MLCYSLLYDHLQPGGEPFHKTSLTEMLAPNLPCGKCSVCLHLATVPRGVIISHSLLIVTTLAFTQEHAVIVTRSIEKGGQAFKICIVIPFKSYVEERILADAAFLTRVEL